MIILGKFHGLQSRKKAVPKTIAKIDSSTKLSILAESTLDKKPRINVRIDWRLKDEIRSVSVRLLNYL